MNVPQSLQARLALSLGLLLTLLWIAVTSVTTLILRHEMGEVFDSALEETAQRILPLAVSDLLNREEDDESQRLGAIDAHDEFLTYVVRDDAGNILLQSHAADAALFPPYDGAGFRRTATHRIYNADALQGTVRLSLAEPLAHRSKVAREIQLALVLPLLIVVPLALLGIITVVRAGLLPLRRYRKRLEARDARDLSPVPGDGLPSEIAPIAATLNGLFHRLNAAFEAERSFAANAAHELRTPLAGAIAQSQRLQAETEDAGAKRRAAEIEAALKRLTRLTERLMQLARAEGSPLWLGHSTDLRTVAEIVLTDLARLAGTERIVSRFPARPILSDLDPDAFGIICRNLVENALRHGAPGAPIEVILEEDGTFRVASEGPVIPAETLSRLTNRFERAGGDADGSGLGLAIVAAIADRIGSRLVLKSPRPGHEAGFEASVGIPAE